MKALTFTTLVLVGQLGVHPYDFSAATAQMQSNLDVYGGRVAVIVEQQTHGEIFRFESRTISQDSRISFNAPLPWASSRFLESLSRPPAPRLFYRVRR